MLVDRKIHNVTKLFMVHEGFKVQYYICKESLWSRWDLRDHNESPGKYLRTPNLQYAFEAFGDQKTPSILNQYIAKS